MTRAYKCDFCHQLMEKDFGRREFVKCVPSVKGKHSGGDVSFHLRVDGSVPANACQPCAVEHLQRLVKAIGEEKP